MTKLYQFGDALGWHGSIRRRDRRLYASEAEAKVWGFEILASNGIAARRDDSSAVFNGNGPYVGPCPVRVLEPGVSGVDLNKDGTLKARVRFRLTGSASGFNQAKAIAAAKRRTARFRERSR